VFSYFLEEYRRGRTPNPDVLCNREIKFGAFREHAKRLGGDLLATGHYARTVVVEDQVQLHKAQDLSKDQSYFLHAVSADALHETVFPLGDIQKSSVRSIAREHALPVFDKKDSTGICFIGERPFREFLSTYLPANPGPIKSVSGETIGEHRGLMYYTLGQRQGLGIGGRRDAGDAPWYVAGKNLDENVLLVVQGDHPLRYSSGLEATDCSWISGPPDALSAGQSFACNAKIRYRQDDQECILTAQGQDRLLVTFARPQSAVAPGQFVVFYAGDQCLGGAVIDRAISADDSLLKTG
jgi:tRNA-specific 2-thiouridylase